MDKEYIEREAAFRAILGQPPEPHYPEWYYRNIKELPAADVVEVVHGEWVFDFELDGSNFYKCSVCGRQEVLLAKESTDEYFPYRR